ncbi:MAG: large subunit ribosomal protein [Baekduia sp.]|jgi:large subunit ribosomal protein L9|nr:large subunit ribosomal protein [Miltoncostaeaceae bacterium]MDX6714060.1 large subunit ribosomal protein [Baekduia sp.]
MQAILLQDVDGLGSAGSVVSVSRGYMRNFLQPRRLAELATPALIAEVQRREERRKAAESRAVEQAKELAALLGRTILTLKAKAGDDGRLFGSITAGDVADAILQARGVEVDRRKITVEPPIRAVGTYTVPIELGPDLMAEVKTIVSPLLD